MAPVKNRKFLPYFAFCMGILGMLSRIWLFVGGVDEKGLPLRNHPADICSWVIACLALLVIFIGVQGLSDCRKYDRLYRASVPAGLATFSAGLGIAITELPVLFAAADLFAAATGLLGLLASLCLFAQGHCRLTGKPPRAFLPLIVNVYFLLHLVWQYRQWSWSAQLQVYAIPLVASALLMLACYHRTALFTQVGGRKSCVFFSLAAGVFCGLAIPGQRLAFYLTMALWMLCDTGSLVCDLGEEASQ